MEAGKGKHSPIVEAIADAEAGTDGEIRVHLSKRWIEKDPYARATRIFHRFGMTRTTHRNAVLLYVNLRRRKFAVIGDTGIHKEVGQPYWEELARELARNLRSTHSEKAIALAVRSLGKMMKKHFPAELEPGRVRDPDGEVTED